MIVNVLHVLNYFFAEYHLYLQQVIKLIQAVSLNEIYVINIDYITDVTQQCILGLLIQSNNTYKVL